MIEKISVLVSVGVVFNHKTRKVIPKWVLWEGKTYQIVKIGLHHTFREGRTLYHVFSVVTKTLFFRLRLDTENLFWRLEEISDGLPS